MRSVANSQQYQNGSFREYHTAIGKAQWAPETVQVIKTRMNDLGLTPTDRVYYAIKYHSSRLHSTYACKERGGNPLTQKDLRELLSLPKQTVCDAIDRLKAQGYLKREARRFELEAAPVPNNKTRPHRRIVDPAFESYFANRYPRESAEMVKAEATLKRYRELRQKEHIWFKKALANPDGILWETICAEAEKSAPKPAPQSALGGPPVRVGRTLSPCGADSEGSVSLLYLEEEYIKEEYIPTVVEVSTGAEIRDSQNGMYGPPVDQSGARPEPPKTAKQLPQQNREKSQTPHGDLFPVYWELFIRAGKALCDRDKELSLRTWLNYEPPEQERIIRWTAEQMRDKWSSEAYTPLPQNNLRNKGWLRVAEGRAIRGPEASSERQVIEILKARGYK